MNLLKKIKHIITNLLLSIPFGMKAVEKQIINSEDIIEKTVSQSNIVNDLLRGEVTQAVEEVRYANYEIYREANKYQYIGNGEAVKKEIIREDGVIKFIQPNKVICKSILEGFDDIELETNDNKYILTCGYYDIPKFKIERFIRYLSVEIRDGLATLMLYFDKNVDNKNPQTRMFKRELNKLHNENEMRSCELYSNIRSVLFTTFKADGEDDLVRYIFADMKYDSFIETENDIKIKYLTFSYQREDLTKKYYSSTMAEKYKEKAPKMNTKMKILS